MVLIISLILAILFTIFCDKALKKHSSIFYIIATILSIFTVFISIFNTQTLPLWINKYILSIFTKSGFASALWIIVMWAGALKNGSKAIKKIMPIRGELSIIAAILTLGHNIGYGKTYFVRLFTLPQTIPTNYLAAAIVSLTMICIMVPLTIISFSKIRKKIKPKKWKAVQRFAYLFYTLMYIHILLLYIPMAKKSYNMEAYLNVLLYSAIFVSYFCFRIRKYFVAKKKLNLNKKINILMFFIMAILMVIISILSLPVHKVNNTLKVTETSNNTLNTNSTEKSTNTNSNTNSNIENTFETTNTENTNNTQTTVISTIQVTTNATENQIYETQSSTEEKHEAETDNTTNITLENNDKTDNDVTNNTNNYNTNNNKNNNVNDNYTSETVNEPNYIYNNGTYVAKAYGYDGDIEIIITIENDKIKNITGSSSESDTWYFENAKNKIFNEILNTQQTDVDAYSGATFSSNAIISAVKDALNSAKK